MRPRLPRLLDRTLQEKARIVPRSLELRLTLFRLSSAILRVPPDTADIAPRDLLELFTDQGSAGIFRVTDVAEEADRTRTIRLEHTLAALRDSTIPPFAMTGTVREAFTQLLGLQSTPQWAAGDVDVPEDFTLVFAAGYTDLLSALEQLLSFLPGEYALIPDQQDGRWTLHLRALPDHAACEGRLHRNLASLRITQDASSLCTRVYPFGAKIGADRLTLAPLEGQAHLDSPAQAEWGIISRTIRNDRIYDVPTLKAVAQRYLDAHSTPHVTVTASAADLSAATGKRQDAFRTGDLCRIALPEKSLCLRITGILIPDVYARPAVRTLTLSDRLPQLEGAQEIAALVQQVTAGKLLGGTVTTVEDKNRAHGSFPSPVVHYFTIKDWAGVLDVRITLKPDAGVSISQLRVDATHPPEEVWRSGSFSAMPYLERDALGQIAAGEHRLILHPTNGVYGENCGVSSVITMTVIEKTT